MDGCKLTDRNTCTGCMSCYSSCPNNAIEIITDENGFYFPQINLQKCTNCGICTNVCPERKENKNLINSEIKEIYAAENRDYRTRINSSSGGLFRVFSDYILEKGGYIAGVVLNDNLIAEHIVSNNPDDIKRMQGSKYIQSYVGDCYKIIKNYLDNDKYVLFTGTPCQTAGLKLYLNKEYEKLLTVDFICTCVNPPYLLKEAVKDMIKDENNYKITKINFRDKITGWGGRPGGIFSLSVEWKDKDNKSHRHYEKLSSNLFFQGFLTHLWMKDSCESCTYSSPNRVSDITIGDFWGIDFYDKTLNDNNGLSFTKLNTQKGKEYFENIKDKLIVCQKVDYNWAINTQKAIDGSGYKKHKNREKFFQYASKVKSINNLTKDMLGENKVAILTYDFSDNYGAMLQAYALSEKIKNLGFSPKIIRWSWYDKYFNFNENNNFRFFREKYLNRTCICNSENELKAEISDCSKIIIGGDQVFRIWTTDKAHSTLRYFGDFVEGSKTLASYAASFGIDYFNSSQKLIDKVKFLLSRFDKISVREKSGLDILKTTFDTDGIEVVDPVFFLTKTDYEKLASNMEFVSPENKYIAYMCLQDFSGSNAIKKQLTQRFNDKIFVNINTNNKGEHNFVEHWLNYIKNCEFIITDSFHCVCFAIIFQKPFVVINRDFGGKDRLVNILNKFNIIDRMKNSIDDIEEADFAYKFDWDNINSILNKQKELSEQYLLDVLLLNPKFKEKYFDYDIELDRLKYENDYQKNKIENLTKQLQAKCNPPIIRDNGNLPEYNKILSEQTKVLNELKQNYNSLKQNYNSLTEDFNNKLVLVSNRHRYNFEYYYYRILLNLPFINKPSIKTKKEKYKQKVEKIKLIFTPPHELKTNTWKADYKYLDFYKERYKFITQFIDFKKIKSVMDLGAGPEFLREFIPKNINYYPVDYLKKTENTIIRDFNKGQFYNKKSDVCIMAGLLEYIYDLDKFIRKISKYTNCIVASYRFSELYPELKRDILVNNYSQDELFSIFRKHGFKVILEPAYNKDFTVFILAKNKPEFLKYELIEEYNVNNRNNTALVMSDSPAESCR